jgi:putative ABC transport system permease protein
MEIRSHGLILLDAVNRDPFYMSIRIAGGDYKKVIDLMEKAWEEHVGTISFEYELLDQHYDGIYQNEKQTRTLLYIFAVIAIFISCLGLFGLASFMAERRTKEIGIRKINGASTNSILRLMSLNFTRWVLVANIIAWPLTWWAMKKWLESFAYRIDIPYWVFLVAGIQAFIIALATVSYHAIRASKQNPSMSLRYE